MRCSRHDLAEGPDGLCDLCRLYAAPPPAPRGLLPRLISKRSLLRVAGIVVAVGAVAAVWALRPAFQPAIQAAEQTVSAVFTPRQSSTAPTPTDDAPPGEATPSAAIARKTHGGPPRPQRLVAAAGPQKWEPMPPESIAPPAVPIKVAPPPRTAAVSDVAPQAANLRSSHVIVYSTSWCPSCRAAKAWLTRHEVAYEERDVEANRTYAAEMRALNPGGTIPTIDIDGDVNVGFSSSWLSSTLQKHGIATN
jgi:glutaredoxin